LPPKRHDVAVTLYAYCDVLVSGIIAAPMKAASAPAVADEDLRRKILRREDWEAVLEHARL